MKKEKVNLDFERSLLIPDFIQDLSILLTQYNIVANITIKLNVDKIIIKPVGLQSLHDWTTRCCPNHGKEIFRLLEDDKYEWCSNFDCQYIKFIGKRD
jgi:hypothetical protein